MESFTDRTLREFREELAKAEGQLDTLEQYAARLRNVIAAMEAIGEPPAVTAPGDTTPPKEVGVRFAVSAGTPPAAASGAPATSPPRGRPPGVAVDKAERWAREYGGAFRTADLAHGLATTRNVARKAITRMLESGILRKLDPTLHPNDPRIKYVWNDARDGADAAAAADRA